MKKDLKVSIYAIAKLLGVEVVKKGKIKTISRGSNDKVSITVIEWEGNKKQYVLDENEVWNILNAIIKVKERYTRCVYLDGNILICINDGENEKRFKG